MISKRLLCAVAALLLSVVGAEAQVLYGTIVGQVTDSTGAVVPSATVRITNRETNQSREATSSDAGSFSFPTLPGGSYDVTVSRQGFQTLTAQGITVAVDRVSRVDAVLRVGAVTETVQVSAEAAPLQTGAPSTPPRLRRASRRNGEGVCESARRSRADGCPDAPLLPCRGQFNGACLVRRAILVSRRGNGSAHSPVTLTWSVPRIGSRVAPVI